MEILIGVFLIGVVLICLLLLTGERTSRNQEEDTWNKWIEEDRNIRGIEANDKKYRRWREVSETRLEKDTVPDDYYQSAEYQKFSQERTKKYNELVSEGNIAGQVQDTGGRNPFPPEEEVFYGKRGGRYRIRYNRDGSPYRDYF